MINRRKIAALLLTTPALSARVGSNLMPPAIAATIST